MKLFALAALLFALPAQAANLQAIRVLHVSQYENQQPGVERALVTVVEFEVQACGLISQQDVKVGTKKSAAGTRLAVGLPRDTCRATQTQSLSASTKEVSRGTAITIENPVLVESLLPAE